MEFCPFRDFFQTYVKSVIMRNTDDGFIYYTDLISFNHCKHPINAHPVLYTSGGSSYMILLVSFFEVLVPFPLLAPNVTMIITPYSDVVLVMFGF